MPIIAESPLQLVPVDGEIPPVRIMEFNEPYLPWPGPALELLFSRYCRDRVGRGFEVDEPNDVVLSSEAGKHVMFVPIDAAHDVARDAHVESS